MVSLSNHEVGLADGATTSSLDKLRMRSPPHPAGHGMTVSSGQIALARSPFLACDTRLSGTGLGTMRNENRSSSPNGATISLPPSASSRAPTAWVFEA